MNKQQILGKVEQAWAAFNESFAGLSDAEMTEPGVTGNWSVRDIIAHVTTWEEEALKALPLILDGRRPPRYKDAYGGIDAFNALRTEQKRGLTLAEVLKQLADTHRALVEYVQGAPDELFGQETRFRRRLRLDSYSHYPVHSRAIRDWKSAGPAE